MGFKIEFYWSKWIQPSLSVNTIGSYTHLESQIGEIRSTLQVGVLLLRAEYVVHKPGQPILSLSRFA